MLQSCTLRTLLCLRFYFAMLLLFWDMAAALGATNDLPVPKKLIGAQTAWGAETNGFRAGVNCELFDRGISRVSEGVQVVVLTAKTNTAWEYLAPPGKRFRTFELRDASGALVPPLKGKRLDAELPMRLLRKDLPYSRAIGHHARMLENWLMIAPGEPTLIRDFFVDDVYRVEREGDYTLCVGVAIYKLDPDGQSLSRIDLPPVKMRIHLRQSPVSEGASSSMVITCVAGALFCVVGVLWLLGHRHSRERDQTRKVSMIMSYSEVGWAQAVCIISERQPVAWQMPPILLSRCSSFLEVAALQRGRCAISYIHPDASTLGPHTSRAVQVNRGNCKAGCFTVEFPANRVRGATVSAMSETMLGAA
jgi:hypothetical protein